MGGVDDTRCAFLKDGDKSKFEDEGEPKLSGPLRPETRIASRCGEDGEDGEGSVVNASSFNTM